MKKIELKRKRALRRKRIIRKKIFGTSKKPRLSVFRSNKFIYIQAIELRDLVVNNGNHKKS